MYEIPYLVMDIFLRMGRDEEWEYEKKQCLEIGKES